ncbi:glycosyltransferase family 2 protein [Shewanella sp. SP2S2-4]|uniref:glycosyltransferase family 2 protein n=1 Tax=Shewanella sp. SP2S2-4 TaxID=3063539 RepID=UPI002891BD87|nr:glycosyltransferase family 2 protein [Shewanella sp. SP2S2-4]MDT3275664.1 glycosyltransferase family 2 protein [Shewanella sp. SP2S2-4]
MKNEALVSVLIPVYNVGLYVAEAIQSILNQSYKNIEIIVVDDFSTDNTFEIVSELSNLDKRIFIFRNEKNIKISKTLNKAFSLSHGDFILRMDGDDISSQDRIDVKLNFLNENPHIDIVGCSTNTISHDGLFLSGNKQIDNECYLDELLPFTTPLKHIWLARRKVYEVLNGYRDISGVEDYDFLLRAKFHGFRFTNISDYYGYDVRIGRGGSTISTFGYKQLILRKLVYHDYLSSYDGLIMYKNIKINGLFNKLYSFSSKKLSLAIYYRARKKHLNVFLNIVLCLVSPHMISYLYERCYIRYFYWKNNI